VYLDRVGAPRRFWSSTSARTTRASPLVRRVAPRNVLIVPAALFAETVVAPADVAIAAVVATPLPRCPRPRDST
jgi:hypothetical protein